MKKQDDITELPFPWCDLRPYPVIGVDEVGRGCLAGPVVAGAAWVPSENIELLLKAGVTDSKALSPKKRDALFDLLLEKAVVRLGWITAEEIDSINILQATFRAMESAVRDLTEVLVVGGATGGLRTVDECHIVVDGNARIPFRGQEFEGLLRAPQTTVVKGDLRVLPIAVASIVAKVTRDRWMRDADALYPGYEFEKHKGYGSVVHREAIAKLGASPIHRKTFGGVKEHVAGASF
jgi:ribonuclease HII